MISCIYSPYWWLSFGKIAMVDRFETKRRRSLIKSVHVYRAEYHTIFLRFYKVIFSFIFDSITTFTGYSDRSVGLWLNTHCTLQSSPNYFGTLWLCHNKIALCFGSMKYIWMRENASRKSYSIKYFCKNGMNCACSLVKPKKRTAAKKMNRKILEANTEIIHKGIIVFIHSNTSSVQNIPIPWNGVQQCQL